ncbi:MAG: hypothetical protein ABW168_17900 [Sedimenticola sp.]
MPTDSKQLLKSLYQALSDRPLPPDDAFYVPYMQEDVEELDPVARLYTEIDYSASESLQMVSGQRGTGKSTELLRLKGTLEDNGYIVFHIDMLEYIHTSEPIEISDFLLASTMALAEAAKDVYGLDQIHEGYLTRLMSFIQTEIKLDEIAIKGGATDFGTEIKMRLQRDDSFKRKLQETSRGHISRLVEDAHQFVVELVTSLREKTGNPDQQIVFIIDSFEQIRGHANNANKVHDSIVQLFSTHGRNLKFPMLHMVITVPPYLNSAAPGVAAMLGATSPVMWPSIHTRKKSGETDEKGLGVLTTIISKRSDRIDEIFRPEALRRMAANSGGELRIMFALVKASLAINGANLDRMELPVPQRVIIQAEDQLRRSMLPITDEDVRKLAFVHASKQSELEDMDELPELARLFDFNLIINYRNGDDWYDIHPLIQGYVLERVAVLDRRAPIEES